MEKENKVGRKDRDSGKDQQKHAHHSSLLASRRAWHRALWVSSPSLPSIQDPAIVLMSQLVTNQ